ncbi:MAG: phospho-N-acetylmuramoyl-pentapeptide-transferase, partial [Anaerolineae bacterium]|nr:phospho-N-acetylmuramoyl-pentapeptide-transferase [Anaerolineae bacterium]
MTTGGLSLALTMGGITFLLCVIWGEPFIEILKRLGIGKKVRDALAEMHQKKIGTPTMGGIMIIVPVLLIIFTLNLASVVQTGSGASTFLPLLVLFGFAILGGIDDWEGIRKSFGAIGEGISPRAKF